MMSSVKGRFRDVGCNVCVVSSPLEGGVVIGEYIVPPSQSEDTSDGKITSQVTYKQDILEGGRGFATANEIKENSLQTSFGLKENSCQGVSEPRNNSQINCSEDTTCIKRYLEEYSNQSSVNVGIYRQYNTKLYNDKIVKVEQNLQNEILHNLRVFEKIENQMAFISSKPSASLVFDKSEMLCNLLELENMLNVHVNLRKFCNDCQEDAAYIQSIETALTSLAFEMSQIFSINKNTDPQRTPINTETDPQSIFNDFATPSLMDPLRGASPCLSTTSTDLTDSSVCSDVTLDYYLDASDIPNYHEDLDDDQV